MDLMPSAEQDEIVDTVRSFLAARIPVTGRGHDHVTVGAEIDPTLWRECAELGWLGLGLPEAAGGVGYGLVEEMLLFRELGPRRRARSLPARCARRARGRGGRRPRPRCGDRVRRRRWWPSAPRSGRPNIGRSVTGELSVVHTERAELVVVCNEHVASLIRLDDCTIEPVDPVEGSVSVGRGRADVVDAVAWVAAATEPVFLRGLVLAAAAATGVAEAALALAVQHAGQRVQFGKPIGVNQAIKHWCADMAVSAEGAFAQACYAAVAVRDGLPEAATEASIAKYHADEAARLNSEGCVQIHGAMGFTSEALPHRYVYRAHLLGRCLATRPNLLDRIVQR